MKQKRENMMEEEDGFDSYKELKLHYKTTTQEKKKNVLYIVHYNRQ